jgi:hypothetical protein
MISIGNSQNFFRTRINRQSSARKSIIYPLSSLRGANGSGLPAGPMTGSATKQSSLSSGAHSRDPLARSDGPLSGASSLML